MITHIVCFKLNGATGADGDRIAALLEALPAKIPEIRDLEVGRDVVRSERSYDLALVTRFDSLAHLRAYQEHPDHLEVAGFIRSVGATSITVDYES